MKLLLGGTLFTLFGVVVIRGGFNKRHEQQLIEETPTSTIRSAAIGQVELKGGAQGPALQTPYTKTPCVLYRYVERELQMRGSGKNRRKEWVTIHSETKTDSVKLKDSTGSIALACDEAELDIKPRTTVIQMVPRNKFIRQLMGKPVETPAPEFVKPGENSTNGYKVGDVMYDEYYVQEGEQLYVLGTLKENNKICKGDNNIFIITDKSEQERAKASQRTALLTICMGAILLVLGISMIVSDLGVGIWNE